MSKSTALPLGFMARMAALLDDEFPQFLIALNQQPRIGLRVNTLKISAARFEALSLWPVEPLPWCAEGFLLPAHTNAGMHPLHEAGLYYIQEPSTMAVVTLLDPQPGERVLDLCAAPGGKATHIAARLGGQGLLVANEIDGQRAAVLARNLERWGARNALVLNETPERLAERWPESFDRVLVDAPCSGEGMFRKNEEARYHWSEAHVEGCALRQRGILDAAARLVRPGGRLGYATCTFAPEENEGVIARFLAGHQDFELVETPRFDGFSPGRPEWRDWPSLSGIDAGPDRLDPADALDRTVRLWPHRTEGEGHFIAVMQRRGQQPARAWAQTQPSPDRGERAVVGKFWQALIDRPLPERLLVRPIDPSMAAVYALPSGGPDVEGLRAVRPGWHLGTIRKGRFIPDHALALSLAAGEVSLRLDEPLGSELIARYLRGEVLPAPGTDGWLLVTVAGFPLGWGKRTAGRIKNHYPRERRWL